MGPDTPMTRSAEDAGEDRVGMLQMVGDVEHLIEFRLRQVFRNLIVGLQLG